MNRFPVALTLLAVLAAAAPAMAGSQCCPKGAATEQTAMADMAGDDSVFGALFHQYSIIQAQLAGDSLDGVAAAAHTMASLATANADADATALGVAGGKVTDARATLAESARTATLLANTTDLAQARASFADLSRAMVGLRDMTEGERPAVAYCSMVGHEWLQQKGAITNPYYGSSMLRCGEIVR